MQSSSCGEEEFDSRPDSISSFFNPSPNQPPHQHQHHHHHQQQQLFDPLSTYYDVFSRPTNPHHHHHQQQQQQQQLSWAPPPPPAISHGGAAHPPNFLFNPPNMGTSITSSPLTTTSNAAVVNNNDQNVVRPTTTGGPASSSQQDPGPNPAIGSTRNPKKRSRASRRAPTTVLTTDTSNFRAMVQEFTGIPAPPFSSSSSLPFPHRTRLDLFGGVGGVGSASTPSYLLRPFAHKLHPPTPPTFLSSPHHVHINDNIVNTTASITSSISNTNYQHLSELGLLHKPPQNVVLNVQSIGGTNTTTSTSTSTTTTTTTTTTVHDQDHHHHHQQQQHPITMLSFQSLLQSQAAPSSKPPNASTHDHDLPLFGGLKMGSLMEDLGGGVSSHNNYEDRHLQMGNLRGFNGSFGGGGGGVGGGGSSSPSNATAVASTSQIVSSTSKNVSSNFCGAPSDCHNKGSENVPSRGEGIVDSWICPSD
ncbi:hypothetical protein Sjap_018735 [Stephania japonica]|uniref:VQ domain-containing protein n=1 Tax=Stephania japonica TaxID=461633 RepID=A0AAP0I8M8_9MAGN